MNAKQKKVLAVAAVLVAAWYLLGAPAGHDPAGYPYMGQPGGAGPGQGGSGGKGPGQ